MAQTIGVNREVSVTSGNGGSYPPRTTVSSYTSKPPQQQQHQSQPQLSSTTPAARTRPRAKSASNLLTRPSQDVEFHDDTLLDQQDPEDRQDGLAELIDFLRNHAPPSGNFMSIPDDISDEDRGRWYRLRKLGRRRSSRSLSKTQTIRLPDSAVSGITIGGHRHIAISIPLDASPFGRTPRSQYPVYQHRSVKPLTSRYAPTRAVLNDKGVVTVLRTVTEDRESSSTSPASSQSPASVNHQRPQSTTLGRAYSPGAINSSSHGDTSEYFNVYIPATPPRVLSPDQVKQSNEQSREFHDYDQSTSTPTNSNRRDNLPSRNTSMTGGRFVHPGTSSIDAMMSQPTEAHPAPLSFNRPPSKEGSQSLSKSIMTTSENDPIVAEAKTVEAKPVAVKESRIRSSTKKTEETPVTVITTSPLGNSREKPEKPKKQATKDENSPTPSVKSTQSRREKVRDKKRKDMEAQRIKRQSQLIVTTEIMPESDQDKAKEISNEEDTEKPPPVPVRSPQRQSICPIMVVANVKPSPPPSSKLPDKARDQPEPESKETTEPSKSEPKTVPKTPSKAAQEDLSSSTTSPPRPYVESSSNPTPPQSAHGSPAHKKTGYDRTSLSRRREWNAAREQERKVREARAMSPRSKARKLVMTKEETEENKVPMMEKEVLRRYEAYREYRIREMERRVRRLERNGDVWLRALVPVLDNLNRTLANVHEDQQPRRAQGWVSDEELPRQRSPQGRPSRQTSRGRMLARPGGTSEREFLEQLVRTKEELEAGNVSDDMSGFDTIEPLMRELAGRSRLSFEARSLGMEQDGLHAFAV
ncbi:hypothetical protein NCS57_00424000 [Fusarium keratoplasticum]|uniref:Uncharacterized protein n=1 Tax=Fusarium keratoplasticum TaxID=1328300 RepID=A0ACC0R6F9_9HYPO|nr:hypothetical protein NCS57_00424000 [Fusarium keratoplasticum]KAI8675237.1 hypothetical protein NCS57_00424000 [Fusarium keratoplasticum]